MTDRIRVPGPVRERAEQLKDEHDYPSLGEAVRHAFREAGYDV